MPMILKLKAKLAEKRAAANKLVSTVAASAETRDMSPDEKAKFDGLMTEVETIKGQIATLQSLEDETRDEPADEPVEEPRSNRRSRPIGEAPAIHTEKRAYSFLRALRLASDGELLDGLEGEVSREIEKRSGRKAKGFFMPTGQDPEIRAMMTPGRRPETRADLTTSTGAGSIFTLPELPLIELLRAKMVTQQLGATMLTNMSGLFAIPRQSGTATVYWLNESGAATATAPSVDNVGFSPKQAVAAVNISRAFMDQTSLDAEAFVKNDLALGMAREFDKVAISGGGTNQPVGILQTAAVTTASAALQGGTNGLLPTWAKIVGLESLVASSNADSGSLAYLTTPGLRGAFKVTPKIGTTFPTFIWQDAGDGVGEVNGYKAMATTNVPSNLTKGSSSGICHALIFGDFSSLVMAQWEGVDVIVNPYTNQLSGGVIVSMHMSVDVKLRHPESFGAIVDALTS